MDQSFLQRPSGVDRLSRKRWRSRRFPQLKLWSSVIFGPSRASVLGNLTPVAAIGLSALILGEAVGLIEILGICLILAGVWVVNRQTAEVSS